MLGNVESLKFFAPELLLGALTVSLFLVDLVAGKAKRPVLSSFMLGGLGLSLILLLWPLGQQGSYLASGADPANSGRGLFEGMVASDPFALYFKILFVVTALLVTLFSLISREVSEESLGEYLAFIAATTFGSCLLAASDNMLMVFLTLELVSVPCYVLAGYIRRSRRSSEASLKYVIYGAASSGIMVYGISLLYGATGSLAFSGIRESLVRSGGNEFLILAALVFILAGLGYKIAVFPFHMWSPDVYEGAPTPITAFLSVGPKAAGFAVLVRMMMSAFSSVGADGAAIVDVSRVDWPLLLAMISAATMTVGNLLAINQGNIKRMLAYSSIAHAGYLLMGPVALSNRGIQALLFYFAVYLLMNLGAFLVVIAFRNHRGSESIEDYAGLGWASGAGSVVAVAMVIFLFSLTGVPPFGGFVGKVYLFASVIETKRFIWLAVVAIVNSVISLYYYARVIKAMFLTGFEKPLSSTQGFAATRGTMALIVVLAFLVTISGIFWGPLARWVGDSASLFLR